MKKLAYFAPMLEVEYICCERGFYATAGAGFEDGEDDGFDDTY